MPEDPNANDPNPSDPNAEAPKIQDASDGKALKSKPGVLEQALKSFPVFMNLLPWVIALAILAAIGYGLMGKRGFLNSLADKDVARGLITFLIAITTVGIAVILAMSTLFGNTDDKSFDKGKQVLTALIGVLGTIVGFYFGSSIDGKATQTANSTTQQQGVAIAPAIVSNSQPKKGETFTISSFVYGGKPPYSYSVTFDPSVLPDVKDAKSPDGYIRQDLTVPQTLEKDADVKYLIDVKDSENKTVTYNKDGAQKISVKLK